MFARFYSPYLLLILATLFWSGNMVVGRAIHGEVPPFALAFWRWAIALALTLPFALPHLRREWPRLKEEWKAVTLLGLLGVGGYNTFAYIALQYTEATNASLLNSFSPIATIALSWVFLGKRLSGVEGAGVLISLSGVAVIVSRGEPATLFSLTLNVGDLWMLAAVLVWALYTIGLSWRPAGVHPMLLLAALTVVGLSALAPFYAWEMAQGRHIALSAPSLAGIVYIGTLPSFVGFVFYNRAVGEVGAGKASLFIHLMPVFGTLLSALFLGEVPRIFHGVGIGLIFLGIYLTTASRTSRPKPMTIGGLLGRMRLRPGGAPRRSVLPEGLWRETLDGLPFLAGLDAEESARLKELAERFLAEKEFTAAGGLELTDAMYASIAAQGCLPILDLGLEYYRDWVGIVVYPDEFVIPRTVEDEFGVVHEYDDVASGEAWEGGPLLVSWRDAQMAGSGYNVVIHEFAHKLDMRNGEADGVPPLPAGIPRREWEDTLLAAFDDFCVRIDSAGVDEDTPAIDPYASESPGEFFAVLSETFFEAPEVLYRDYPTLYALFVRFYRQDPIRRKAGRNVRL